jgi:alpha-tubulin suppressor-like RCC1 family protein
VAVVRIAPDSIALASGATAQLHAVVEDSAGNPVSRTVTWATTNSAVATIDQRGVVTGEGDGLATITATVGAVSGSAKVTVRAAVASVTITLEDQEIVVDGRLRFDAVPRDSGGVPLLDRPLAWSISDPVVAGLAIESGDAVVSGLAPGTATLTATSEGRGESVTVTVAVVRFADVAAAESDHTCGRTAGGAVYCWGADDLGQLGNGVAPARTTPSRVTGAPALAMVSPGGRFTCALASDGDPYCWGSGASGRLGNGSDDDSAVPVAVASAQPFDGLSSGWGLTCGIAAGGGASCWGNAGALGSDTLKFSAVPVPIGGELSLHAVGVGNRYACALAADSAAYCWGMNLDGRLGSDVEYTDTPLAVVGGLVFDTLVAGPVHACALTPAGAAWCWGGNTAGQRGDSTITGGATPGPVAGGLAFRLVSAGTAHTCGLTADGSAWCWGSNAEGRLGTTPGAESCAGLPCSTTPVAVSGGLRFVTISAGGAHTCGIATDGVAYCWGANAAGQLGDGSTASSAAPVRVVGQP